MVKAQDLNFVIITGLSGAGKSEAIHCFEDMGYFCIDNLPPQLISKMAEMSLLPGSKINKVAVVCDIRGGMYFLDLLSTLGELRTKKVNYRIIFLDATDEVLVKRFKETRRKHPLSKEGSILDGIHEERAKLEELKAAASLVMNTSKLSAAQFREQLRSTFYGKSRKEGMLITIYSFGFKYGLPLDTDIVFDVRFLPNPHYVDELREFDGETKQVKEFVLKRKTTKEFLAKMYDLLDFIIPLYIEEGKSHLSMAIGCTGGMHRSVVVAAEITRHLKAAGYNVILRHRDRSLRYGERQI